MLKYKIGALFCAILLNCNSGSDVTTSGTEPLTDVLTLELSFGDKDLPDEYLLANPRGIAVNDEGDVFVTDEDRVKVFGDDGKEKAIIGRNGRGQESFGELAHR